MKKTESNAKKFTLELYNPQITEFYFRSGLNAFIVEYTKKTSDLMKVLLQTQENIKTDLYNKRQI